jgi:DNA-binding NarL/FixJ family response regulator
VGDAAGDRRGDGCLRVLFVDDDPLAIGAFRALARDRPDLRIEAVDPAACPTAFRDGGGGPCVALIDLFLHRSGTDGIELARRVTQAHPDLPVAICTVSEATGDASRAWNAGIRGYLTKHRLLQRGDHLSAVLWSVWDGTVLYHVDPRAGLAANPLSAREVEILQRKHDGESHRVIAGDLFLSVRTIDSHLANARAKLGAESVQDALRLAEELGLLRRRRS